MTTSSNLNAIAIDLVGHYGRTAKNLVATYRAGTERALKAIGSGTELLLEKQPLPWLNGDVKTNLLQSQRRAAHLVVDSADRLANRASRAVDRVAHRTVQGLRAFDQQTAWANRLLLVGAIRKINLPVARLSLRIAGGVDEATRRLSQRVAGPAVAKAKAKATAGATAGAKTATRRVRRAARTVTAAA